MARRLVAIFALLVVGCGAQDEPLSDGCVDSRGSIERALEAAPGRVTMPGGTRLSACVRGAGSAAELQTLGALVTQVADDLGARAPRDPQSALRLGYLVGAVGQGARATNGVALELAHRLEQTAALDGAPARVRRALRRGMRAGKATG